MKKMYLLTVATAAVVLVANGIPVVAAEMDDRIESSFKESFIYKKYLKDENIKISSREGAIILSGSVSDESDKLIAYNIAEALPDIKSVDNRIEITGNRPDEKSDIWISMKVKGALMYHRNVNSMKTEVSVKDGIVTLKGEAASQAQKELTAEYAKDIDGVKEVSNEMTIAAAPEPAPQTMTEKIDDASVTAQVRMALLTHNSTRYVNTKIVTKDGEVTLTGIAKNDAEKSLVTKLVTDIQGVVSVKNQMTVEEVKTK
ncbi:MAG: Osmotically-inducible protein OsmY, contains BON domain [Candidatus Electronema aureum]|uniref:Osmotically-inducible protein OsmY, contains BON domain n=1 Tax=Candidatus Electronema aureum TaxID=2005002 RepID=A0A521FYD9_9BACT|nr:MAG: Osmotically-inducible protein OsmY, contains BON domain [Candidatus Electronema aureum]